jgi:hypothetical protein
MSICFYKKRVSLNYRCRATSSVVLGSLPVKMLNGRYLAVEHPRSTYTIKVYVNLFLRLIQNRSEKSPVFFQIRLAGIKISVVKLLLKAQ